MTERLCEDADPACPVCHGRCKRPYDVVLYRTDMEDRTGTRFCDECADDALESGLFYYEQTCKEGAE
ncbi:MAG: hypothetical protein FJW35_15715 [Acidobacteria bacterium]|nr:hypothetical protein [Acidobacteriota bacterium]